MPPRNVSLTDTEIIGITKSFDSLSQAVDALQNSVQRNAVDHATIKTKLEDVLENLKSLAHTVSGDKGLVSRVSVLEARLQQVDDDMDRQFDTLKEEVNREVKQLRDALAEIKRAEEAQTKQELKEIKGQQKEGKKTRIAVWGAFLSTGGLILSLIAFGVQHCDAKAPAPKDATHTAAKDK